MKISSAILAFALSAVPTVYGWGANGHMAVGFVAMPFLSPKALSFVQSSLGSTYNESLGPAATWADDVKSEAAYKWSADLHFVDAEDNPPTSCSVSESRDCSNGQCILTAIANYTTRVVETSLSAMQRQEALKFLDHFIGDIGQPLHVEALEVGGNDISVKCSGSTSNLHSVWDSGIINKLLAANYSNSVPVWSNNLIARIKTGAFKSLASNWISCSSVTEPLSRRNIEDDIAGILHPRAITPLECPLVWAQESNAFDCSFVFNFSTGQDLCTSSYFTNAVPIIEMQIAKQGFRLAAWLNVLFDGATNLP
ncbi:nuclease Le1 [Agrocybe pediades]|nr:nuclease Le1 [Agrocybe pediades]